jgi:hypothetical protein
MTQTPAEVYQAMNATNILVAILDTQKQIKDYKHIFENELTYRNNLILDKILENQDIRVLSLLKPVPASVSRA